MSTQPPQTPIAVDALEPTVYRVTPDGSTDHDTWRKTIVDVDTDHPVFYVRIAPNAATPVHWHPSDTVYIVRRGELRVPGEETYREGDVRWVRAGTVYGPEAAGPEGCEFYWISCGPFGSYDPDVDPPPAR